MSEKPKTDQTLPHRELLLSIEAVLGESCTSVSDGFPSRRGHDAARMISQALRRARAH